MAEAKRDNNYVPTLLAVDMNNLTTPVKLAADPDTNRLLVTGTITGTPTIDLTKVGGETFALGQQLAAASLPVVLTAAQLATLTPPAAITGFATETTLSAINTKLPSNLTVTSTRLLVDGSGVTQPVSGTFWQATQPVSLATLPVAFNAGTVSATTQRVQKATGSTSTQTQVADSASSQTILAANTGRIRATIVNDSTTTLYLRESASAATTSVYTYKMYPDETVIIDDYNGALTGIWSANASGNAVVSEVTA